MTKTKQTKSFSGEKVGRLSYSIAKEIGKKCADIYISKSYLRHIEIHHGSQLSSLGFTALTYVRTIARGFNQIRKGSDDSLLLVVFTSEDKNADVAAISLVYDNDGDFWQVKTAQPRSWRAVSKKEKLW